MSDYLYDPCSFANPDFFMITHAKLDWTVDFNKKILKGSVDFTFELNSEFKFSNQENSIV
jgi:hypothetical protein